MDIFKLIELLRTEPKQFTILGRGAHCLGLSHKDSPNDVLLLEEAKESSDGRISSSSHARAVGFARQSDELLSTTLSSYKNIAGVPFIHSDLYGSASPETIKLPIYLHIGKGHQFVGRSARLIRRIPGVALNFLDFVDESSGLSSRKTDRIAKDIASWLYVLHHEVSVGVMVRNKVNKQFKDAGTNLCDRALNSEKYKIFVVQNLAEIQKLGKAINSGAINPNYEHTLTSNMENAGVNFDLMESSAQLLAMRLKKLLPKDRIGLCHSDIHPANIIVNREMNAVSGICDWMTAGIDAQSVDFAGLGLARGLLPKVVMHYSKREKDNRVVNPVNIEAIYAYAAMRSLYTAIKSLKGGYGNGSAARVSWEQVGECFSELSRINPRIYGALSRRHKRQRLPPLSLSGTRTHYCQQPRIASTPR